MTEDGQTNLFNYKDMDGKIAHSFFTNQAPAQGAGEMMIADGKLKAITCHSGHYNFGLWPKLKNPMGKRYREETGA